MTEVVDGGSPRRGSLMSLHRQSSGSLSKVNSSNSHHFSNSGLCKDLDKYTKHFIIKTVQVIVQSRIGGNKRLRTECKNNGNDWFNINIHDIPEVSDQTKSILDFEGFSVRSNWKVCCEISLKTSDGGRMVLEHWILSNRSKLNSSQNKLNSNQGSPVSTHQANRLSPLHLSGNNGAAAMGNNNPTTSPRIRTYSHTPRTRLNSIDDCTSDSNFAANKLLAGNNNENYDIKSSTSCFSLSSTAPNQLTDPSANNLISSPSTTSLSNNLSQGHGTNSQSSGKTPSASSIYTIYNRMSLLLKTLLTTAHIVPAYKIASRMPNSDSCSICYRVYVVSPSHQNQRYSSSLSRGSLEDVSPGSHSNSPNKRSPSNLSLGSLSTRDFIGSEDLDQFSPILRLGSIQTEINELELSLYYRSDIRNSSQFVASRAKGRYNKLLDEDCITAAKQLLACNEHPLNGSPDYKEYVDNDAPDQCSNGNGALDYIDQPLKPAFAQNDKPYDKNSEDPSLDLVESAFEGLLHLTDQPTNGHKVEEKQGVKKRMTQSKNGFPSLQSEPIQVPSRVNRPRPKDLYQNLSAGSTPKSLTDSFVFVDLNPPFASEEQNDINSFFHGPAPAFTNGFDAMRDVEELTSQLAVIEANASQLDEFVDNMCASEDDDEDEHQ